MLRHGVILIQTQRDLTIRIWQSLVYKVVAFQISHKLASAQLLCLGTRSWLKVLNHRMFRLECLYFSSDSQSMVYHQIGPQQISCLLQFK